MIDFSRFSSRFQVADAKPRHVPARVHAWARVAALLAGACVAPVVIQVVLFSSNLYATGTTIALALPFLLGVWHGDAVADRRRRHRGAAEAGPWMVRVKQAFGVFILATAAYYGYLAYELFVESLGRCRRGRRRASRRS